jgi:hypothetical protein
VRPSCECRICGASDVRESPLPAARYRVPAAGASERVHEIHGSAPQAFQPVHFQRLHSGWRCASLPVDSRGMTKRRARPGVTLRGTVRGRAGLRLERSGWFHHPPSPSRSRTRQQPARLLLHRGGAPFHQENYSALAQLGYFKRCCHLARTSTFGDRSTPSSRASWRRRMGVLPALVAINCSPGAWRMALPAIRALVLRR